MLEWETLLSGAVGGLCTLVAAWLMVRSTLSSQDEALRSFAEAIAKLEARYVEGAASIDSVKKSINDMSAQYLEKFNSVKQREEENRNNIVISNANLIGFNIDYILRKMISVQRDVRDYIENSNVVIENYKIPALEFLQTPNFTLFDEDITQEIADLSESFQAVKDGLERLENSCIDSERMELARESDAAISDFSSDASALKEKLRRLTGSKNGA
jgi:hypothetical protein